MATVENRAAAKMKGVPFVIRLRLAKRVATEIELDSVWNIGEPSFCQG